MATRYGHEVYEWLLKRGWKAAPIYKDIVGDPQVIDPTDNKIYNVYTAAKMQKKRTGEYPDFLPKEFC